MREWPWAGGLPDSFAMVWICATIAGAPANELVNETLSQVLLMKRLTKLVVECSMTAMRLPSGSKWSPGSTAI